jgi:hypothetical protein
MSARREKCQIYLSISEPRKTLSSAGGSKWAVRTTGQGGLKFVGAVLRGYRYFLVFLPQ